MKTYLRCKACGFILTSGELRDVCPACGVNAKSFEPYEEKVSEKRKSILDMHFHPVMIHFPQTFGTMIFVISLFLFFVPDAWRPSTLLVARVFSFLLPVFLLIALGTGIFDGTIRFRRITTPILKLKLVIGSLFLLSSVAYCLVLGWSGSDIVFNQKVVLAVLGSMMMLCATMQGVFGTKLLNALFPG
jgi:hypothetical protein